MSVLSALVHVPTSTSSTVDFKEIYFSSSIYETVKIVKKKILDFIQKEILVKKFEEYSSEHSQGYSISETVCAAIKLWSALVTVTAESKENENNIRKLKKENKNKNMKENKNKNMKENKNKTEYENNEESENENENEEEEEEEMKMSNDINDLINVLYEIIDSHGSCVGELEIDGTNARNDVYEAAATSLVGMIKLRSVGLYLSVEKWHQLGWIFLTTNDKIKRNVLLALNTIIQTTAVHPRFLSYSCLLATDDVLAPMAEQGENIVTCFHHYYHYFSNFTKKIILVYYYFNIFILFNYLVSWFYNYLIPWLLKHIIV